MSKPTLEITRRRRRPVWRPSLPALLIAGTCGWALFGFVIWLILLIASFFHPVPDYD